MAAFFGVRCYLYRPVGHMLRGSKSNERRLCLRVPRGCWRHAGSDHPADRDAGVRLLDQVGRVRVHRDPRRRRACFRCVRRSCHVRGRPLPGGRPARKRMAAHSRRGADRHHSLCADRPDWPAAARPSCEAGRSLMANVLLSAKGITIRFGGVIAADGIDLDVHEGENLAIIGPNGAGKTTFLNISTGYLRPQAGSVSFLGRDITAQLPRSITRLGIARAFQIPQLFLDQTVMENMLIAAASLVGHPSGFKALSSLPQRAEMERLLDLVGVKPFAERKARALPEGQRKLVDIALALALKPRLLLMDEPTSGVALSEKIGIMDILTGALAKEKVTSVFGQHGMDMVEPFGSRVAVWSMGKIQKIGSPAEVLADPKVREHVIGI